MQKCKVSWEETFHSAKYPRNEKEKKSPNLNCFQFHMDTTQTEMHFECYGMTCTRTREHGAITRTTCQVNHQVTPLPTEQARTSLLAQVLGNSLSVHCKAPRGLISQEQGRLTQARLCAAMTYAPGASRQPGWRSGVFSLGCITAVLLQGWGLYWCTVQMHLGGSSEL